MGAHGKAIWNELGTRDLAGSKQFYSTVLGWTYETMDAGVGPYTIAREAEGPAGGLYLMEGEQFAGVPQHWLVYFAVDDVDAACAAVSANGGDVRQPPFDIPTVGRIAVVADPSGGMFGLMTPAMATTGA